jgi:arylsulfatase A-like enzyme
MHRLLFLAIAGLLSACPMAEAPAPVDSAKPAAARPNIVLISVDTLRADHLSAYGYERATSPNFDRLANGGVLFEQAFSPTSWTLPGHASMLTGVDPTRHGATNWKKPIRKDIPLLAEVLSEAGYATKGVVNGTFVKPGFGFDRGFDSYEVYKSQAPESHHAAVMKVLDSKPTRPFFYFFHYMRVHGPYAPSPDGNPFERPFDGEISASITKILERWHARGKQGPVVSSAENDHLIDLYDGAILAMDAMLAQILDRLDDPSAANTYVILTADHGEEFMEHGFLGHSLSLYDEVIKVPLIIRGPGIEAGKRVRSIAGLIDIVPTVLDLLEIEPPSGLQVRA